MPRERFWIGLDVGEAKSSICVLNSGYKPVLECTSISSPDEIAGHLSHFKRRQVAAIAMETGAAHGLARRLLEMKLPVLLLDAGKVSRFLSIRHHKTDRNDARGLAEIARLECHEHLSAWIRGNECQTIRDQLIIRNQLVRQRAGSRNALRSMLRNHGSQIRAITSGKRFREQVGVEIERIASYDSRFAVGGIRALVELHEAQASYIKQIDQHLQRASEAIPVIQRFREIPGVGPICAMSFYSTIEDPFRFTRNVSVGAYLGMVPRLKQSGLSVSRSGISKAGDRMTRGHLFLSAGVMMSRAAGSCEIKDWGKNLAARIGYKSARIAVARKIAIAMLSIWKSGDTFRCYRV